MDVDQIIRLYRSGGAARYGREAVSQEQHALQCGQLAQLAGHGSALVAAALLHDLGHLLPALKSDGEQDDLHEDRPAAVLCGVFPAAVTEPIRLHVAAKRYLCCTEPGYQAQLSPASQRSLALQGGPFRPQQAQRFAALPFAQDAIALRRWDDLAKSPTCITPGWEHFRPLLDAARLVSVGAER